VEKKMSEVKSAAVKAYELDKAKNKDRENKGELEQALEDTFPASDPVSQSSTSVAGAPRASQPRRQGGYLDGARGWIKSNPLAAVAITAAIAWIYGSTR
jgi:hypothetical protein